MIERLRIAIATVMVVMGLAGLAFVAGEVLCSPPEHVLQPHEIEGSPLDPLTDREFEQLKRVLVTDQVIREAVRREVVKEVVKEGVIRDLIQRLLAGGLIVAVYDRLIESFLWIAIGVVVAVSAATSLLVSAITSLLLRK